LINLINCPCSVSKSRTPCLKAPRQLSSASDRVGSISVQTLMVCKFTRWELVNNNKYKDTALFWTGCISMIYIKRYQQTAFIWLRYSCTTFPEYKQTPTCVFHWSQMIYSHTLCLYTFGFRKRHVKSLKLERSESLEFQKTSSVSRSSL
jgi:hypothetical protein